MKHLLRRLLLHPKVWPCGPRLLADLGHRLELARYGEARARLHRSLPRPASVQSGPFRGLRYPELRAHGSALEPKLLGTYEQELHPLWEKLQDAGLTTIYDIGCAEGYYAVGLARRFSGARVLAFDTDPGARESCARMAQANGVADRVTIGGLCDEATLLGVDPGTAGLLIADCEGCERELFTAQVLHHLARWHLVIELHAPVETGSWSQDLYERCGRTHAVRLIPSLRDADRIARGRSPLVDSSDPYARNVAFAEHRPDWMKWLVATPHG